MSHSQSQPLSLDPDEQPGDTAAPSRQAAGTTPTLPEWAVGLPLDLDADNLRSDVDAVLAAALAAARIAGDQLAAGHAPNPEVIVAMWVARVAAGQLAIATGISAEDTPLSELANRVVAVRRGPRLLARLTGVEAAAGAKGAATALRQAARDSLDGGRLVDELKGFAALLDCQEPPAYAELQTLLTALPAELHPAVLAASKGLLTLPPEPLDTATAAEPPAAGSEPVPPHAPTHGEEDPDEAQPPSVKPTIASLDKDGGEAPDNLEAPVEASTSQTTNSDRPGLQIEQKLGPADEPAGAATPDAGHGNGATRNPSADIAGQAPEQAMPDVDNTADTTPAIDSGEVTDLLIRVLASELEPASRAAACYWIVRAGDGCEEQLAAFEMLSYATAMRREGGPVGRAFDRAATRVPTERIIDDRTARILAVTAGLRATLVAPYAARGFLDAIADHYKHQSALHAVIGAVLEAALSGAHVGSAAPSGMRDEEDDAQRMTKLSRRARELVDIGPSRNLGYQPATRVWRRSIDAERGWLGRLLVVVANDERGRAKDIRTALGEIAEDQCLMDRIEQIDKDERGQRAAGIHYHQRDNLVRRMRTHLGLVADWLDIIDRTREATHAEASWSERVVQNLRRTVSGQRADALRELAETGDDKLAGAAAGLACTVLDGLFDRLLGGAPFTGREPELAIKWFARPLLRTDVPMDLERWEPEGELTLDQVVGLVEPPSWPEALTRRLDRLDLEEAAEIVTLVAFANGDADGEELEQQLHDATAAGQQRATALWQTARDELATAKREGYLDATAATIFDQRLDELNVTEEQHGLKTDGVACASSTVGGVLRKLRRLRDDLATRRIALIEVRRAEVTQLADDDPQVDAIRDEVLRLINDGQLVQAEERVHQVVAGVPLPTPSAPMRKWALLIQTLGDPTDVDRDLSVAIENRGNWHGLDFGQLSDHVRARAVAAAIGWMRLADAPDQETTSTVAAVMNGLGLELPGRAVSIPRRRSGGGHRWYDVSKATTRGAPVPQFGSRTRGHLRILTSREPMTVEQSLQVLNDETGSEAVIHLHLGVWTPEQRRVYTAQLRASHLDAVLPVDAAVFAARLSAPDESWAATCMLALPYTATNPYQIDAAGRVLPSEMFFGRAEEKRLLLDPTGPTIVFGGRQLGKTALLKQVRDFHDAQGSHMVAVYLDIKNETHGIWGRIHHELGRAGIDLPDPRRGESENAVSDGVQAWLDDDPRRRLLILLDEADRFLTVDREDQFARVHKLKSLMDATDRRCKIVFAGLHQVGRFQRDANHPFAHLGRPIAVGGLAPQDAYNLLERPLHAIGYTPVDSDVLLRAVTYSNYHPAILQRFGHTLVERLHNERPEGPPPWPVTHEHVQEVFNNPEFGGWVSRLVDWTLQLDKRYSVIAYTMAMAEHEQDDAPALMTVQDVMCRCEEFGAPEFNEAGREDEIVALLDELVHLGVLRQPTGSRWQLRSRYVTRMLGGQDEILQRLVNSVSESRVIWEEFDPAAHRRRFESDRARMFPFTDRQVEIICSPRQSFWVLVASNALGAADVFDALKEGTAPLAATRAYHRVLTRRGGSGSPPDSRELIHRVVLADVREIRSKLVERAIAQAANWAADPTMTGSISTLVMLDARSINVLRELLDQNIAARTDTAPLMSLRRLDGKALQLWADTAEFELSPNETPAVLDATGGWPLLICRAARQALNSNQMLGEAAAHVAEQLDDPDESCNLVAATGADLLDGPARVAWDLLLTYGKLSIDEFQQELAKELGGQQMDQVAIRERMLLEHLGLVHVVDQDIAPESRLVAAWNLAHQVTSA